MLVVAVFAVVIAVVAYPGGEESPAGSGSSADEPPDESALAGRSEGSPVGDGASGDEFPGESALAGRFTAISSKGPVGVGFGLAGRSFAGTSKTSSGRV